MREYFKFAIAFIGIRSGGQGVVIPPGVHKFVWDQSLRPPSKDKADAFFKFTYWDLIILLFTDYDLFSAATRFARTKRLDTITDYEQKKTSRNLGAK
jgi:hypothetical protein